MIVHVCYRTAYAFIAVPHARLITRMSTDANERASIGGVKAAAGGLGTLCAGYLGLGLIDWIGGADEQAGFVYFGVILGALTIVSVLVSGLITRERVGGPALDPDSASLLNARSEEHTSELQSLMRIT